MNILVNTVIGLNRGSERIWVEQFGLSLAADIGQSFELSLEGSTISATPSLDGTLLLSKRTIKSSGVVKPLLELRSKHCEDAFGKKISDIFTGCKTIRVVIKAGVVLFKAGALCLKRLLSVAKTKAKLRDGNPLSVASFFSGVGVFDRALHKSFENAGISSEIKLLVERESDYLNAMLRNQPELFSNDCTIIQSDTKLLDFSDKGSKHYDLFVCSPACTSTSPAGRAKTKRTPEECPDAGCGFLDVLRFVQCHLPTVMVLENERSYKNTAGFKVIENRLKKLGYSLSYEVLDGVDFGGFEPRKRVFLVASLLFEFDFDNLAKYSNIRTINSVLEDVELDSNKYKTYSYLESKRVRDEAEGKGFARSVHNGSEFRLKNIIRRQYAKAGSCDPYFQHPLDDSLTRLFTSKENANLRDVSHVVVDGLSETKAHQALGQSGVFTVVTALFDELAYQLNKMEVAA